MSKDTVFITLLKKHTNIDVDFINTFFKQYKIGSDLDFHIQDTDVAKYLGISLIYLGFFALIGSAVYFTQSATCLWALLLTPSLKTKD